MGRCSLLKCAPKLKCQLFPDKIQMGRCSMLECAPKLKCQLFPDKT